MPDKPRISAIVITYNQEDVISRTLDSLLAQEYLYEICVSDDCSTDGTWKILQEYEQRWPGVLKLHRNEVNLGIFANEEQTWGMPSGDLVYRIAGDDECCPGYFRAVVDFICTKGLDWKDGCFAIVGTGETFFPDGRKMTSENLLLDRGARPLKLKLRELLNDRTACFSRSILDKYIPVSQGRSYAVEAAQDFQLEVFCDEFYRIPAVGNVYYAGLGVSSRFTKEEKLERVAVYECLAGFLERNNVLLDRPDRHYLKFRTSYLKFVATHSLSALAGAFWHFMLAADLSLGLEGMELARLFNALKRKVSH